MVSFHSFTNNNKYQIFSVSNTSKEAYWIECSYHKSHLKEWQHHWNILQNPQNSLNYACTNWRLRFIVTRGHGNAFNHGWIEANTYAESIHICADDKLILTCHIYTIVSVSRRCDHSLDASASMRLCIMQSNKLQQQPHNKSNLCTIGLGMSRKTAGVLFTSMLQCFSFMNFIERSRTGF